MTHATFSALKVREAADLAAKAHGDRPYELKQLQGLRDFADLVLREARDRNITLSMTDAQKLADFFPKPPPKQTQRPSGAGDAPDWKTV